MNTETLKNRLRSVEFAMRDRVLGRMKLRPGLPIARVNETVRREREFYRLLIRKAAAEEQRQGISLVCDVGCRNWSYAPALAEMFSRAELLGVELDGGRRYWNLHRRIDLAEAYAAGLREQGRAASALHADFLKLGELPRTPGGIAFTMFYPFVSADPCLGWGLPVRYAAFTRMISHALELGRRQGRPVLLISCHQGEWEAEIARESYLRSGLQPRETVLAPEEFAGLWPSAHPVHVLASG